MTYDHVKAGDKALVVGCTHRNSRSLNGSIVRVESDPILLPKRGTFPKGRYNLSRLPNGELVAISTDRLIPLRGNPDALAVRRAAKVKA